MVSYKQIFKNVYVIYSERRVLQSVKFTPDQFSDHPRILALNKLSPTVNKNMPIGGGRSRSGDIRIEPI